MICEKCSHAIQIGEYPFCPHSAGPASVVGDEIDMVLDHIEPGRRVTSKTELRHVLNDHRSDMFPQGARLKEDGWVGVHDQHLKRWIAIPPFYSQAERRTMMAEHLNMTIEEFDFVFPA